MGKLTMPFPPPHFAEQVCGTHSAWHKGWTLIFAWFVEVKMTSGQTNTHRPNLACCLFCKYKFIHLFTYRLWLYLFIANGCSYNTAMPIYLHIGYGCFCAIGLELKSCDKGCMACKAENVCYLVLSEKSFWPLNEMTKQLKWDRLVSGSRGESERYRREKDTEFKIKRSSSRSAFSPGASQLIAARELAIVSPSPQHDDRSGLLRAPCWWRNQIHPREPWRVHAGLHHRGLM